MSAPVIDAPIGRCHIGRVKTARPAPQTKTPGTLRAEAIRDRSNKLTQAERRKLRDEAMRLTTDAEPKTAGMKLVEKYRPRMSRLTDAQRQKLTARGLQIIYGDAPAAKSTHRG